MKAVMKVEPKFGIEIRDIAVPNLSPGEVLVQVKAVGICGAELVCKGKQ